MHEATEQPTLAPEAADGLAASALQAEAWAGEPFLHPDEDPGVVLAPGTARRRALDDAVADEIHHLLEEGVVAEAADVDTVLLLGAGWPFWLGGITKYLDQTGRSERMFGRTFA